MKSNTTRVTGNQLPASVMGRHRSVYIAALSAQATVETLIGLSEPTTPEFAFAA